MSAVSAASEPVVSAPHRERAGLILLGLLLVAVWAELIFKLRIDWSTNGQYEFGPFVPPFIAFLLWQRWKDRPDPESPGSFVAMFAILSILLVMLLPIRLIQEANPDWRPLNWVHASLVTVFTLTPAFYFGGWRWVRHFSAPLVLLFFALPWPLEIEQSVIQSMARAVSAVTAECLNLAGVPALQDGNVIRVPTGPVGIQDACTGVRSLAGTLMASVFFGEFFRLNWPKRFCLLGIGILIAFGLNLVRTFWLGWIAANQGIDAIAKWHDQTGLLIFCVAFGALWFVGELLGGEQSAGHRPSKHPISVPAGRMPILIAIAVWLVVVEGVTEAWYRLGERNLAHSLTWNPTWPEENSSFQFKGITDEARGILRYSEGRAAVLDTPGEPQWQVFFFRWEPGRSSSQLAVLHRPDICLPAAGLRAVSGREVTPVMVDGVSIPFESFVFDSGGLPLYVFRTLSEDRRPLGSTSGFDQSISGRLRSAWHARRNLGQKLLQIGILGPPDKQLALADLEARLPRIMKIEP